MDDKREPKPLSGIVATVDDDLDIGLDATVHSLPPKGKEDLEHTLIKVTGGDDGSPVATGTIGPGARVGRYVILERLAAGGMGEVFAAWDPHLDRKVALKLLRASFMAQIGADVSKSRLIREAQAMAKLSHPNIVTVHDVGATEAQVFIAMEFLDGGSLFSWLEKEKRPWADVLRVFLEAGRGLAAAHKAGIVHRDFKPQNVIVTHAGRVCVLDFGIARAPNMPVKDRLDVPADEASTLGGNSLTQAGAVMGTPGYMSPEQYRGEEVDSSTDQFSFCVALYEALYGRRPWDGTTLGELRRKSESGEVPQPPPESDAPSWLFPVLKRGLNPKRGERFASMDELLVALSRTRELERKKLVTRLAVGGALLAVVGGLAAARTFSAPPCPEQTARWEGIWDEGQQKAVQASFAATSVPYADSMFKQVEKQLGAYRAEWLREQQDACVATRVRGEQSAAVLDWRMGCFARRLSEARAVSELLQQADKDVVANAVQAVSAIRPATSCSAESALASRVVAPAADMAPKVEALRARLASAMVLLDTGKQKDARTQLDAMDTDVQSTRYDPLLSEFALAKARLSEASADYKAARAQANEAAIAAEAANDGELATRAWTLLALVEGARESRYDDGRTDGRFARATMQHTARPPELEADLEIALAMIDRDAAKYEDAVAHEKRALQLREAAFGPEHPLVGQALRSLAWTELWKGDLVPAREHSQKAVKILEATVGENHPAFATAVSELGTIEEEAGEYASAIERHKRALSTREALLGPNHFAVAATLNNMAPTLLKAGRVDEASAAAERALKIFEEHVKGNQTVAYVLQTLGEIRLVQKRPAEAVPLFERGLSVVREQKGSDALVAAYFLTGMGEGLLDQGEPKKAVPLLEEALKVREGREPLALQVGKTRSALARALLDAGGDVARARKLAEAALADFKKAGKLADTDAQRLEAAMAKLAP